MVDAIGKTNAKHIIVNSMAAANLGVQAQGPLLDQNTRVHQLRSEFTCRAARSFFET
jgi:hypothetical protein